MSGQMNEFPDTFSSTNRNTLPLCNELKVRYPLGVQSRTQSTWVERMSK